MIAPKDVRLNLGDMVLHLVAAFLAVVILALASCEQKPDQPNRANPEGPATIPAFPWPPPAPSASVRIPQSLLVATTLRDVADQAENALDNAGYNERSYFSIPSGFALVSHLEQINDDGTSRSPPERWACEVKSNTPFSLIDYIKALFTAQPGRFRVIVFLVTDEPFVTDKTKKPTRDEAMDWLADGATKLPARIASKEFSSGYDVIALIYEFERPTRDHAFKFRFPSDLSGKDHLEKAGLWPPWRMRP